MRLRRTETGAWAARCCGYAEAGVASVKQSRARALRFDRNFEDSVAASTKQSVRFDDLIEREFMSEQGSGIKAPALHQVH